MRLIILGAGGYGKTVCDLAEQSGKYDSIAFLDDNSKDAAVVGKCADYEKFIDENTEIYPAFGNNTGRLDWINKLISLGAKVPSIIHSTAYVSPKATLGTGSMVLPCAVVNTDTVVKNGVIVNCNATVDHGCIIEDGVHICLGAIVKAENRIPACMKVEAGEVIENRKYPITESV